MLLCGAVVLCACMSAIAPTTGPPDVVITRDQFGTAVGVKDGWRLRAVDVGETDIVLTLITTGDAAPPRLAVNIQVTR